MFDNERIIAILQRAEKIETRTVWQVSAFHDDRGTNRTIEGYAESEACAKEKAKGNSFYGANGSVRQVETIVVTYAEKEYYLNAGMGFIIPDTTYADALREKELREGALSKLSEEERKALGL